MNRLFFDHALLQDGWADNVLIDVDDAGTISAIETDNAGGMSDHRAAIALPGLPNLHSHAFQRAMAGRAEIKGDGNDSFWTWRQVMYQFLERITPDDLFAIASMAYCEMLESGFTSVCEFHYLHHGPDGLPYDDIGEMSQAIAEAAKLTGIGITFLPVFYAHSQFGGATPGEGQRRFVNNLDQFGKLVDRIAAIAKTVPNAQVGIAPHSLRAVTSESLNHIATLRPEAPLHIHIAEQTKEVDDCISWSGQRPVEWLLSHADVDQRWCLVHATHLNEYERTQIAASGAVAGLCPITEANLGDGIFDGVNFLADGGIFGLGSDSNVLISAAEELRVLEYSQRLRDRARNLMSHPHHSTGHYLYEQALQGGAQASGRQTGQLAVGSRGDITSLDINHPAFAGATRDSFLDCWIFAANGPAISEIWVGGEPVVAGGAHIHRHGIRDRYTKTIRRLLA